MDEDQKTAINALEDEIELAHRSLNESIDSYYRKGDRLRRLSKEQHFELWDRMREMEKMVNKFYEHA